jgi:hypothetical protein
MTVTTPAARADPDLPVNIRSLVLPHPYFIVSPENMVPVRFLNWPRCWQS